MIAHVDADSFFASVIIRQHPALRGKPLLAVGMGGGCVIAATYEAKTKGVKTGMRLSEARLLVPGAIEMAADFRETGLASRQIEATLLHHSPVIQQASIDEWYMDLSGVTGGVPKQPEAWGKAVQNDVLAATALSVSVGIAQSKLLAKMAGEYRKPAGVTVVEKRNTESFLRDCPIAAIPGIGRQRQAKADAHGWKTAWDLATAPDDILIALCGRPGVDMKRELLGETISPVTTAIVPPQSISRCRSFRATTDEAFVRAHMLKHLEYCTMKMRRWGLACGELSTWIRTPELSYRSARRKLSCPALTVDGMLPALLSAVSAVSWHGCRCNQAGLMLYGFRDATVTQRSLFENPLACLTEEGLQSAMDDLHGRFGRNSVTRASALAVSSGTTKGFDLSVIEGG